MYKNFLKPLFDFIIALAGLIFSSPIVIGTSLLLLIANKGKVFFVQPRPGRNEKIFNAIKFKTMNDAKDSHGNLLPDDKRLTWIGSIVRKTSIDEIPQLINVIKGDMSLIGPRPWLVEYLPLYNDYQRRRHKVKPGITGWAQVNGRNMLGWEDRFKHDIYYVDHCSLALDIKIIWLTIGNILKAKGVSNDAHATMPKFTGQKPEHVDGNRS